MKGLMIVLALLIAGCVTRTQEIDAVVAGYDVRPLRGQLMGQTWRDVEACRTKILDEPGQLEVVPALHPGYAMAIEIERRRRYERCLKGRGYSPEPRPMTESPGER